MVFLNYDLGKKNNEQLESFFFVLLYRWILQAMKLGLEHLRADAEDAVVKISFDRYSFLIIICPDIKYIIT
jgi:hypothetical protein